MKRQSRNISEEQEKSDLLSDKLSSKEYTDSFKGGAKVAKTLSLNEENAASFRHGR